MMAFGVQSSIRTASSFAARRRRRPSGWRQPGAGQHRLKRLGDHRHVDDDAVALGDALGLQRAGKAGHAGLQFLVGDALLQMRHRAVVDDRQLVAAAGQDMAVNGVPAGVGNPVGEPFVQGRAVGVQRARGALDPVDCARGIHPEPLGIGLPPAVDVRIAMSAALLQDAPLCYGTSRRRRNAVTGNSRARAQEFAICRSSRTANICKGRSGANQPQQGRNFAKFRRPVQAADDSPAGQE